MNIVKFCLQRSLLMNLLTVLVLIVGVMKAMSMQREAFPSIDFDIVSISTTYLGASPKEVELYVTTPLEREIKLVSGTDEIVGISVEGRSMINIKLDPDLTYDEKRTAIDDIQRAVDRVNDLPDDIPDPPDVRELKSGDLPVIDVSLGGDMPYSELHAIAERLAERLEDLNNTAGITKSGLREREYWVQVDPKKLKRYNISLTGMIGTLAARNLNLPGGALKTASGEVLVRTIGEAKSAAEIEAMVLRANDSGLAVRVGDVATVSDTFEEEKKIVRTNSKPGITLRVIKSTSGDILNLVDDVKRVSQDFQDKLGDDRLEIAYVNDISNFVRNRLGVLINNGGFGTLLVIVSLLLLLSPGIAIVAALGMPVAFMGAIAVAGYAGMTINLITMFGLVIVLGMLVDDAIIVAENIWQHYEEGASAWDAAVKGTSEVFWPVTATILTTIAAFSPLLMISGIFGKFVSQMPKVVIIALVMSLIEAMFVLPTHAYEAIRIHEKRFAHRQKKEKASSGVFAKLIEGYGSVLRGTLRWRWLFVIAIFAVFLFTVGFAKNSMRFMLFPQEGIEAFFIKADLPVESSLEETASKFEDLEKLVKTLPPGELKDYVSNIGIQQEDPNDPFTQIGSHLGQIMVLLTPAIERERTAPKIIEDIRADLERRAKELGFTRIIFQVQRAGPPVGKPVAIRVKGDDLAQMTTVADKVIAELQQTPHVSDVGRDYRNGKDELLVHVDDAEAARSLLTVSDIAQTIRTAFEGQVASYVRLGDDRIGIRLRYPESYRQRLETLENLTIANQQGRLIQLSRVAKIDRAPGINAIFHREGRRTITVTAAIDETQTSSDQINRGILPSLKKLEKEYPQLVLSAGGEFEDTQESLQSLQEAFIVAAGIIFLILATQFSSLTQPLVVMSSIPFGIIGVVWAFYVHNLPISFLGLIGTIGLSGVIVNDSIVLVDFLNKARDRGMDAFEAAVYAGKRRFRAVWLTTVTTVLGLLPLVYGIGGNDLFLQPAAVALGYGLLFGTVLVLFFVPAVYLVRVDIGNMLQWLRNLVARPAATSE